MLEGLAAYVLNNYLGKYVENLNTDQLSIALLSGKVELENLPLRKDALRHLGLPVEIKAGFIGKVKLQIPVRQIRSAPWVVVIEQLYLVASPLPVYEWDAASEELSRQELKLATLDSIEAKWRLETDSKDNNSTYYASSYSSWLNFGTGVISDIIENIQLKIQDVHIRYEDNISINDKAVAFGLTIDSLSAQSCDANWTPGFSHWKDVGESFKLLEMQKFGIYWLDLEPNRMLSKLSLGDLAVEMSPNVTARKTKYYILPPVSAQAHVKRNRSEQPLRSEDVPRLVCDLRLEEVPITLIDWQYDQMVKCFKGLDNITQFRSYRRYKPACSIKENSKAWWIYAINCFYPGQQPVLCKPKPTWESCLRKAKENVAYVSVYCKILQTPTITLTSDEKKLKEDVEWDREFEELRVLREIAMQNVKILNPKTETNSAGRGILESWFPHWMGWQSAPNVDESTAASEEASQLEGEILQVLSDSTENNTILRRDALFGKFNFCLKRGSINLCTILSDNPDNLSSMLELEFKTLSVNLLTRPRTGSHLVELSLDSLYLKDKITLNTLFPVLVGPPAPERNAVIRNRGFSPRISVPNKVEDSGENLFYLAYEKKPKNCTCDYRLCIKTKSLDVVYQPNAIKWLLEFLCLPHQKDMTQSRIEAMKTRTKKELIKNWEHILDGRSVDRATWELEFDISAPQIIFVEHFNDSNSAMAVIDFGRLQLRNYVKENGEIEKHNLNKSIDDDETFVTPCSTPPQSEASDSEEPTLDVSHVEPLPDDGINEVSLHRKIYERYSVELTDLQVLLGKIKDNWRYAHNKGSSTLHILDRFNISIQIERRIIHTVDPSFPSLTLNANLPNLVAHVNENKIISARKLLHIISTTGLPSPFRAPENTLDIDEQISQEDEQSLSLDTSIEMSRLLMVQFTIDQMSLEVQSRSRSIAELQVAGVKIAFMKRSVDINVTLTVHSLLLVDALQTFGPDFELLVASHKHVGMDSMSGSLRDSEPTSPKSPASPDPCEAKTSTSPIALKQALNSLASSSAVFRENALRMSSLLDAEALITIEIVVVTGVEPVQIANIQFNNLDIIANQETIVELMGFIRRVIPKSQKSSVINLQAAASARANQSMESLPEAIAKKIGTTELTFDFHRLNILLLRGTYVDGTAQGRKICTATMTEAKVQATVCDKVEIEGSLGGLQVLDLTPEGHMHQRIMSVGKDPLHQDIHPLYMMSFQDDETKAFCFKVVRNLESVASKDIADITIRMASLWYTHSPQFVNELESCATEFKQYMANLARSIKSAATDMALGLVHARAEALAQSLYMNARLSSSIYGSALSFASADTASPRRRRRSESVDPSGYSSARDTIPQTPYSPEDEDDFIIDIKLDIELDSPVVVLPRSSNSNEVFVAHLGKINVTNKYVNANGLSDDYPESRTENYNIEIRDMNLFSLDVTCRRNHNSTLSKPEVIYSCETLAKPVLHDTIVQLNINREIYKTSSTRFNSESNLLLDEEETYAHLPNESIQISGSIVTALKVSLTRSQYQQLLDTFSWLTSAPRPPDWNSSTINTKPLSTLSDITEEDTGVSTLSMDPHVRAKLFPSVSGYPKIKNNVQRLVFLKVVFELPIFTIELRGSVPSGEQGLIDLTFQEFLFTYEKTHKYETNIQVSLRSIFMEDLLQPEGSKQRAMIISSSGNELPQNTACVSRSCPDVTYNQYQSNTLRGSLPDHLGTSVVFGIPNYCNNQQLHRTEIYPNTPPPSPSLGKVKSEQNLVLISVLVVDKDAPNFQSQYGSIHRSTSIDFNCLDLGISIESWVLMIDFFSVLPTATSHTLSSPIVEDDIKNHNIKNVSENTETNITVRSLTVVLIKTDNDVAKANISNVEVLIKIGEHKKEVSGKLGSLSLLDLTLHGQFYRERFLTSGKHALQFHYSRDNSDVLSNYDAQLKLDMSSVMYVHTKRFVAEIQAFFNRFTQLQTVMKSIRAATSGQTVRDEPLKLALHLQADSPIILLPVSSKCSDLLVADLGQLLVKNSFKWSRDEGTISVVADRKEGRCLLDVMKIDLQNMDLYTAVKESDFNTSFQSDGHDASSFSFQLGSSHVTKRGASLLTEKFGLKLQVERNLSNNVCHCVPDMSIYGQLSTLDATLDHAQYCLIRGLLAFNLGEDTENILPSVATPMLSPHIISSEIWILSSLKFDLQNVRLRLRKDQTVPPLTCINFIKSHLLIETFSNFSQDIDLVSQEILVHDSRTFSQSDSQQYNIFTNILQPIKNSIQNELVQFEIHSRKRQNHTKFTFLINNMRLMAIFDWWEAIRQFIFHEIENVSASPEHQKLSSNKIKANPELTFEVNLNITNSEIVVVENTAQWDTNAVILKSTTIITYKPTSSEKPLSCSLNHCEMFSCILGMEDETALSIIDPVTLTIEINSEHKLEAQLQFFIVRLSYHDMKMFLQILNSLPKQMFANKQVKSSSSSSKEHVRKLATLGFKIDDCIEALENSHNKLDDAALWLTKNAVPQQASFINDEKYPINIKAFELKANCISLCIIDDCGDSDVPLVEISLTDLDLLQTLPRAESSSNYGLLNCVFAGDYYNRFLSGWEPIVEPWSCKVQWFKSNDVFKNRLNIDIDSSDVLNINLTSTLLELYKQVKENWIKDYYDLQDNGSESSQKQSEGSLGYRQRSPFVPYALKNETGSLLHFNTIISEIHKSEIRQYKPEDSWITVAPGEIVPFSFKSRDKMRHQDSHKMKLHQLAVKVEGWQVIAPVTVDKVGVYFRQAPVQIQNRSNLETESPPARIVFDVTLEGSARKLVTIRSALCIRNKLSQSVEIKLDSQLPLTSVSTWVASKVFTLEMGKTLSIPLQYVYSEISIRPCGETLKYTYCVPSLSWILATTSVAHELRTCHSHKGHNYRFCAEIVKEKYVIDQVHRIDQPAHRITLLPTVKLVNLLPIDLNYQVSENKHRLAGGASVALTNVDLSQTLALEVTLENFISNNKLIVPAGCSSDFTCRLSLRDNNGKKLNLQSIVTFNNDARLKIVIFAPYWIVNRTGLPLVFKQAGTSTESAGQFEEHEVARMVSPLLFSFSDQDASPTINARVGYHVVRDGTAQWCLNFHTQKGTQVRKLHITMRDGRPDTVFVVGIEIRQGRGKYQLTSIITISPRYQLHNRSSYQLVFCQSYFTKTLKESASQRACLRAMPNSHMPFHWPRLDQEQLLCVLIHDIPDCCWSGGLQIDTNNSMHVNIRDSNGRVYFLRLEVVLQGATFFIVFTDADTLPPPIRVDNFSEVNVRFAQASYRDVQHSTARAHSSVPYAWDQPTQPPRLTVEAPGGVTSTYNMNKLGPAGSLTYENFIYIAFVGTFKSDIVDPLNVESQELVLDVMNGNRVILARKRQGQRSQLWRMTSTGQLQHEGSSPPSHPHQPRPDKMLVLDIEGTAPQPNRFSRLMLRRVDGRRVSTQTWRFTDDGCLRCAHSNMCVQAQDGIFGLHEGSSAILGMPQPGFGNLTDQGVPIERAVGRQRLRPGSGFLSVEIITDGPTRVLVIKDVKENSMYALPDERDWSSISLKQRPVLNKLEDYEEVNTTELQMLVRIEGLGLSLVCRKTVEELLYANFKNIVAETKFTPLSKSFDITVEDVQFDNQLLDTSVPVVLHVTPPNKNAEEGESDLPAIIFKTEVQQKANQNAVIFNYFILRLKKITVILEERLLLTLFDFLGFNSKEEESIKKVRDENDFESQRLVTEVSAAHAKRYYFGVIQLIPSQIRLSVKTASKLFPSLQKIKRKLGLTLLGFENAAVDLKPFDRKHPFETSQFLFNSILKHFKDELLWQAGNILGSVDFLGNPMGFVNDVSEGFSGLIYEGNVGALFKNVTHGISNSAAKVTESLSDGLGKVSMDDHHEEIRQKIRQVETGRSRDHIMAGFKGLGFGLLGGATGIFKQVYEGASNDGIQGVFSGIGKGLVGAVTKPVVGVLDLASETARAVRDSSKSKIIFERQRPPRCVQGYGGLLPRYNLKQSQGQQNLYFVNDRDYKEHLIAFEVLGKTQEDFQCIISNKKLRIVTPGQELTCVMDCNLEDLIDCKVLEHKDQGELRYFIELVMHVQGTSSSSLTNSDPLKRSTFRCKNVEVAHSVAQQIKYARRLYLEYLYTLSSSDTINNED